MDHRWEPQTTTGVFRGVRGTLGMHHHWSSSSLFGSVACGKAFQSVHVRFRRTHSFILLPSLFTILHRGDLNPCVLCTPVYYQLFVLLPGRHMIEDPGTPLCTLRGCSCTLGLPSCGAVSPSPTHPCPSTRRGPGRWKGRRENVKLHKTHHLQWLQCEMTVGSFRFDFRSFGG